MEFCWKIYIIYKIYKIYIICKYLLLLLYVQKSVNSKTLLNTKIYNVSLLTATYLCKVKNVFTNV